MKKYDCRYNGMNTISTNQNIMDFILKNKIK